MNFSKQELDPGQDGVEVSCQCRAFSDDQSQGLGKTGLYRKNNSRTIRCFSHPLQAMDHDDDRQALSIDDAEVSTHWKLVESNEISEDLIQRCNYAMYERIIQIENDINTLEKQRLQLKADMDVHYRHWSTTNTAKMDRFMKMQTAIATMKTKLDAFTAKYDTETFDDSDIIKKMEDLEMRVGKFPS